MDHLEGEEVVILGTDVNDLTKVYPRETVAEGIVDIGTEAAHNLVRKVGMGLPFRYTLKPMRLDYSDSSGTTKGRTARINSVTVSFLNSAGAKYGKDVDHLHDFAGAGNEFTEGELYTGDLTANLDGGFGVEDDFVISGDDPLPCIVRCMVVRKDVSE